MGSVRPKARARRTSKRRINGPLQERVRRLEADNAKLRTEVQELRTAWDIQRVITKQYSDQLESERAELHRGVRRVMARMVAKASPAMAKILSKRTPGDR